MRVINESGWIATAGDCPGYPTLQGSQTTDWLIVGGGLTGLAAARRLAELRPAERVVLIDRQRIAQGAAARNSGFNVAFQKSARPAFASATDERLHMARLAIDRAGARQNADLIARLGIDCDYREDGFLYGTHDLAKFRDIERHAAFIVRTGGRARILAGAELARTLGTDFYRAALWIGGGNGVLQPAKFSRGLAATMPEPAELYENTEALGFTAREGGGATVRTPHGEIAARNVIFALNAFLPRFGLKRDRMFPVALTASLTRPLTDKEEAAINHAGPFAMLAPRKGGATFRLTPDRRLMIRNTAEYRPRGIDDATLARRRALHVEGLGKRFAWAGEDMIAHTWSGTLGASRNGAPVFETLAPGVHAVGCGNGSGVSRLGMLGRLMAEHAAGEPGDLIENAFLIAHPQAVPTGPLFTLAARARFAWQTGTNRSER